MPKMYPVQIKGQPHGFILVEAGATAGGGGDLSTLNDVDISGLADGFILKWDAGTSKWITVAGSGGVTDHGALTGLFDDDHPQYHNNARGDARYSPISHNHPAGSISNLDEAIDDRVAALLVAGANMTLTYNDAAGTLTLDAAGGGGSGYSYFPSGWS